jgi:hypothetical protein
MPKPKRKLLLFDMTALWGGILRRPHNLNQGWVRDFFGLTRFDFGLTVVISASLLGKVDDGNPAKGAFADRFYPKSMGLPVNQLLIWGSPLLI